MGTSAEQATVDGATRKIGFPPGTVVQVQELEKDASKWKLLHQITYHGTQEDFVAHLADQTDFASVPNVFVWFLPRYGKYTKAAIIHDRLWEHYVPDQGLPRIDADGIFRQAMRELGVPFLQRWVMWSAVRWGALMKPDGRRGWWKEAPRVLLMTALALPIVFPPAIFIGVAMLLWYVVERIAWVPLKLAEVSKLRRGQPAKKVNAPKLHIKL